MEKDLTPTKANVIEGVGTLVKKYGVKRGREILESMTDKFFNSPSKKVQLRCEEIVSNSEVTIDKKKEICQNLTEVFRDTQNLSEVFTDTAETTAESCVKVEENCQEEDILTEDDAIKLLTREHFQIEKIKPFQLDLVNYTLKNYDTLGTVRCGEGKTLVPQLVSLKTSKTVFVVAPFIAIALDQLRKSAARNSPNLKVLALNSETVNKAEVKVNILKGVNSNNPTMIYVTPEEMKAWIESGDLKKIPNLGLVVIDEAQSVLLEQGFRKSFIELQNIKDEVDVPVQLLSGSLTPEQEKDLCNFLKLNETKIVRTNLNRPDIHYSITREPNMDAFIELNLDKFREKSILYCATKEQCHSAKSILENHGITSLVVTGLCKTMTSKTRSFNIAKYLSGHVNVLIGTKSIESGLDVADTKNTLIFGLPSSPCSLTQIEGRTDRTQQNSANTIIINARSEDIDTLLYMNSERIDKKQAAIDMKVILEICYSERCCKRILGEYYKMHFHSKGCCEDESHDGIEEPQGVKLDRMIKADIELFKTNVDYMKKTTQSKLGVTINQISSECGKNKVGPKCVVTPNVKKYFVELGRSMFISALLDINVCNFKGSVVTYVENIDTHETVNHLMMTPWLKENHSVCDWVNNPVVKKDLNCKYCTTFRTTCSSTLRTHRSRCLLNPKNVKKK